jgi:membrane-associated phospholipid phosphatase
MANKMTGPFGTMLARMALPARAAAACVAAWLAQADAVHASERAPDVDRVEESAPPPHRLSWDPYPRFRLAQYLVTFGAPVLFRIIDANTHEAEQPRWRSPVLFDNAARDLLRARSEEGRNTARQLSDYGWYGAMAWPIFDAAVVALALDQNVDVAWQLSVLAMQAYALSGFVTLVSIKATARQRPLGHGCSDSSPEPSCSLPPRGFPSGHSAGAFAGAGLVCASHLNLPLYGSGAVDRAACIGALTLASGTALLRVSSDRHYASDVIVGAGIGSLVGYVLPTLFQYATNEPSSRGFALVPARAGAYLLTYGGSL